VYILKKRLTFNEIPKLKKKKKKKKKRSKEAKIQTEKYKKS
jgi:hypothetical protein